MRTTLVTAVLAVILLASCSKDQTLIQKTPETTSTKNLTDAGPITYSKSFSTDLPPATDYGSASVLFSPLEAKPTLTIFNNNFSMTIEEYTIAFTHAGEGYMIMNKIPAGVYEVLVHPRNTAHRDIRISPVTITAGRILNLGSVQF